MDRRANPQDLMPFGAVTKCYLCGGTTQRRQVTAANWWGDELALVENVPAWVCEDCGEQYFDARTAAELDDLRERQTTAARVISVPVYAFTAA